MVLFGIVFSDGKLSFSQYLLTQDKVKLLKGKRTLAEEFVFNFIPREKNYESSFYQNFLPFDEELDEKMELAYELRIYMEKISSRLFVFTRDIINDERLDAKILSITNSFNLNIEYEKMRYDALEEAFLNIIGGEYFTHIRKVKGGKNVLLLEAGGGLTYLAVIALKGSPDESLDPECMNLFVNSIRNLDLDVSFVVPFRFVKVDDSDYMLKKDLKVRIKVNDKFPVRYFETSPYLVVRGSSIETIRNHAKRVCIAASAAFSGIKKRISVDFLDSNMVMKFLHRIICRRLLPEREILSIRNLGIYLRLPNQSVGGALKPQAVIPKSEMKGVDLNNRVLLGNTILKGRSVPVWMDYADFSKHLFIFGDSNQKTCFLASLLLKISKPWIIFDFKGEFSKLKDFNNTISLYDLGSNSESLRINLFDSKEKSPEEHASFLLDVFKKIFESDFTIVEKLLSGILSHFCNTNRCKKGLVGLNQAFDEILEGSNTQNPSIIREVANMLHSLQHGILSRVFNNENSNPDFEKLSTEHAVINLASVMPEADINQVKFLLTYIIMSLFKNSSNDEKGIRHITVINSPENGSELVNFLIEMFFDKSTPLNRREGLILLTSHIKDFSMYDLDSCYRIIFDGVRMAENSDETSVTKLKIENPSERALMVIPGVDAPIILYPDYGKISTEKEKINPQIQGNLTKKDPKKSSAVSRKTKAEIQDNPDSENSYTLLRGNFITADQLLRGFRNSNHVSKSSYNLTGEQIKAFADKISHMLESEVYLTDIYISRITGFPPKMVNKIIHEVLNMNLEIQRIYVPVVGSKGNIPLYYSKFGPKYENVQDKYLKDNLEELCFKRGITWTVKRDPETGADGKIDSYVLKLITQLPKDDQLKNIFKKLFLKSSQVAVLFLYDKDLEKVERLNTQWRLPLIMGCLSNLNAFLTEIMATSTGKISNKPYTPDSDLEELISWLESET